MSNNQKGFVNIVLVAVIALLLGVAGYVALMKRPAPIARQPSTASVSSTSSLPITAQSGTTSPQSPYPATIYTPLASAELAAKEKAFVERNGPLWKVSFDDYGFIDVLYTEDPALRAKYKLTDQLTDGPTDAASIESYRQFLLKNSDFFGIDDPASLTLKIVGVSLTLPQKGLEAEQKIAGMSFLDPANEGLGRITGAPSGILITHSNRPFTQLYMMGHWWPKALVPTTPTFSADQLKSKLVGIQYTYQPPLYPCDPPVPGGGCPAQDSEPKIFAITKDTAQRDATNALGPYLWKGRGTNKLELRLGYNFKLSLPFPNQNYAYVTFDAMTGDRLIYDPARPMPPPPASTAALHAALPQDTLRMSDLKDVMNSLEFYFNKCNFYPGQALVNGQCPSSYIPISGGGPGSWTKMTAALMTGGGGASPFPYISRIPLDSINNTTYFYQYAGSANGTSYTISATLQDPSSTLMKNSITRNPSNGLTCGVQNGVAHFCIGL